VGDKTCPICRKTKLLEKFGTRIRNGKLKPAAYCTNCANIRSKQYRQKLSIETKQQYNRKANLKRFGLSPEAYVKMLSLQCGVCAICKQPETWKSSTGQVTKLLAIDHCHRTKKIRKLLCHSCNLVLGYAKDNPVILVTAAQYLMEHQDV
jgi:hypothetical protein